MEAKLSISVSRKKYTRLFCKFTLCFLTAILRARRQRRRFYGKQPSKAFYEKAIHVISLCG
jgi:hypothetical protein